jgi:hypothetical protein
MAIGSRCSIDRSRNPAPLQCPYGQRKAQDRRIGSPCHLRDSSWSRRRRILTVTSPKSTERHAGAISSHTKISKISAAIVATAIVAFAGLCALLGALGSSSCDIYCGPAGVWVGTLILVPVTLALWLAGLILAAVSVGVSRSRSWLAWSALGLSLVIPVTVAIGAANIGWSNFASY